MGKLYRIDMNIPTEGFTPNGGFLLYQVEKTVDARGFKERTGAEVFAYLSGAAISGANQRVSFDELRGFRKVQSMLEEAAKKDGKMVCNKTELDVVKNSIRGNKGWPNTDEMLSVLEVIVDRLDKAEAVE
jgi:hypothetical protein